MYTHDPEIQRRWAAATSIAIDAGRLTLKYFRRDDLTVDRKSDATPVTIADREAELLMRERIMSEFPDDAILGEEFGERPGISGWQWVLDPIDGTKSFIHGVPLYGTLIGVGRNGIHVHKTTVDENTMKNAPGQTGGMSDYVPVIGVAMIPAVVPGGECVTAALSGGAWVLRDGEPPKRPRVSDVSQVSEACLATSEFRWFARKGINATRDRLESATRLAMSWGDAFGYVQVALGRAEVMVDVGMNLWDVAAIPPIIHESGGRFTDWTGSPGITTTAVATNGPLHDEILRLLRK